LPIRPSGLQPRLKFIPKVGRHAAVGRAVILEPFRNNFFPFSTILGTFRQALSEITRYLRMAVTDLAGGCMLMSRARVRFATGQSGGKEFRVDIGNGRQ
jgi:hypothetical protein